MQKVEEITITQLAETITRASKANLEAISEYNELGIYVGDYDDDPEVIANNIRLQRLKDSWIDTDGEVLNAYGELIALLNTYSQDLTGYSFHFFAKPNEMESKEIDKIGGFCSYSEESVWVKFSTFSYTEATNEILEVLNHELAHALCFGPNTNNKLTALTDENCSDLSDTFEGYLVKVGILMARKWPSLYAQVDALVDIINRPLQSHRYNYSITQIFHNQECEAIDERYEEKEPGEEYHKMIDMLNCMSIEDIQRCVKYPQFKNKKNYLYQDCEPQNVITYQEWVDGRAGEVAGRYITAIAEYYSYIGGVSISPEEINQDALTKAFLTLGDFEQVIKGNRIVWKVGAALLGEYDWYHSHFFYSSKGSWEIELAKKRAEKAISAWATQ